MQFLSFFLRSWVSDVIGHECSQKNRNVLPFFLFLSVFLRSVAENKTNKNKTLSRTWESLRLVCAFSSSNWHPSSCENLRWRKRRLLSSHFSLLHLWEQNRQEKVDIHRVTLRFLCVCSISSSHTYCNRYEDDHSHTQHHCQGAE